MSIASPFELLQALDRRCRKNSAGLPAATEDENVWMGIGFSLEGVSLVARMDEVSEILTPPETIRVPGVKQWIKGLANIRGSLMPVIDLKRFLMDRGAASAKDNRVLVINKSGLDAALLVDQVYGMRRFKQDDMQRENNVELGHLGEYLNGCFESNDQQWNVFSMEKLIADEKFLLVV